MRSMERLAFAVALFAAVAILDRADAQGGNALRTSQLEITNADGRVVLRLSAGEKGGGRIEVLSPSGKRAAVLSCRADSGGELLLYDDKGRLRTTIGGNDDGGYLSVRNGTGKRVVYLGASTGKAAGDGVFELYRADGKLGVVNRANAAGSSVATYDSTGRVKKALR
ncbi:MAG: hypothetical protein ACYTGN_13035 [Planctomycetota bacterium]|jgi:hypothetical protein